jgi:hypothetical protein
LEVLKPVVVGIGATQMILYRRTDQADAILHGGFRDAEGAFGFDGVTLQGVFLSDVPVDCNEGAQGDRLLEVTLPEGCCEFDYYELVEQDPSSKSYREWCFPAAVLSSHAKIRLLEEDL